MTILREVIHPRQRARLDRERPSEDEDGLDHATALEEQAARATEREKHVLAEARAVTAPDGGQ